MRSNTLQGPRHNFKAAAVVAKIQLTTENEEKECKLAEDPENKHQLNDRIEGGTGPKAKEISSVPSNQNLESDTNS